MQMQSIADFILMWSTIAIIVLLAIAILADKYSETKASPHDSLKVITGGAQHIGAREQQQDAYAYFTKEDAEVIARLGVFAVLADGMGGFAMGQEASQLAIETFQSSYKGRAADESVSKALMRALQSANSEVFELAKENDLEWNVGTTLIAAVIQEGQLNWISVGDSRIFLYRGGMITQLTRDHIYANQLNEQVNAGELTIEEAHSHPERRLLTSYLGIPQLNEIDINRVPFTLQTGDWILLCSDGLYEELSVGLLVEAFLLTPEAAAKYIVKRIINEQKPYQDNATIVILAYQ